MSNIIAIVGRPNVGKSTLFNRLTESNQAIVKEVSGVTRDRHYGRGEWNGVPFSVIDTGGYVHGSDDIFEEEIRKQVKLAIDEANVIIFMVDVTTGIVDLDETVAQMLRKCKKKVFIVANKVDNTQRYGLSSEFWSFGLGDVYDVSATNGGGTGELLDDIANAFDKNVVLEDESNIPKIAIVGKPNVGKSSFLNALLGKDRSIVTDLAGTTRDAIQNHYTLYGKDFIITDTAGIRRKARVDDNIEYYSVLRSIKALEECDIAIILIDATTIDHNTGLEAQDMNIISMADKAKKGIVLMINKWDLVAKDTNTSIKLENALKERLAPLNYMPVIFTSVLEKKRIFQVVEKMLEVFENRSQKVSTSKLNDVMLEVIQNYPPPAWKGKYIKIKYCTQVSTPYPTFIFFCNLPQYIKESYERYLENQMRKAFKLEGTPISLFFRKK